KNYGTLPADMAGWQLRTSSPTDTTPIYVFPAGFVLQPGATVVVSEDAGTDTATELFDQSNTINWAWANSGTADLNLIDPEGVAADFVRSITRYVTTQAPPLGGAIWAQPEVIGANFFSTLSRHD